MFSTRKTIDYPRFDRKDRQACFAIDTPDGTRFYVDPMRLGQESDVLRNVGQCSNFVEARQGRVLMMEESADEVLEVLQCTLADPRKPISVHNFSLLLRFANTWIMEDLYSRCRDFLVGDFWHQPTDLYGTLQMLETLMEAEALNIQPSGPSMTVITPVVGRLMVFGHAALHKAGVFDNRRLSRSVRMALAQKSSHNLREVQSLCKYVEHKFNRIGERNRHCDCIKRLPVVRFALDSETPPRLLSVFRVCSGCDRWLCLSCHRRQPCPAFPLTTKTILPITGRVHFFHLE